MKPVLARIVQSSANPWDSFIPQIFKKIWKSSRKIIPSNIFHLESKRDSFGRLSFLLLMIFRVKLVFLFHHEDPHRVRVLTRWVCYALSASIERISTQSFLSKISCKIDFQVKSEEPKQNWTLSSLKTTPKFVFGTPSTLFLKSILQMPFEPKLAFCQ